MQATGDKGMIASMRKTVRTAGYRGLFDGISGTMFRQMTYSVCRFWAYDESKKIVGAGESSLFLLLIRSVPSSPPQPLRISATINAHLFTHSRGYALSCSF